MCQESTVHTLMELPTSSSSFFLHPLDFSKTLPHLATDVALGEGLQRIALPTHGILSSCTGDLVSWQIYRSTDLNAWCCYERGETGIVFTESGAIGREPNGVRSDRSRCPFWGHRIVPGRPGSVPGRLA